MYVLGISLKSKETEHISKGSRLPGFECQLHFLAVLFLTSYLITSSPL